VRTCAASVSPANPEADELQQLRRENVDLQARFHCGPEPQEWEAWLSHVTVNVGSAGRRFLLLKGRLLQEEWAIRRASQVLSKQQAILSQLHTGVPSSEAGKAAKNTDALLVSLEEAVTIGRRFLDSIPDAYVTDTKETSAAKEVHCATAALLSDLLAVHPYFAKQAEGAACIRSSIVALTSLGPADVEAITSAMGTRASAGHCSHFWSDHLEERCERRSSRRALRAGARRTAGVSSLLALELDLLQAEIDQLGVLAQLRWD